MTVGDSTPTASSFKAAATNKDGKVLEVTADLSQAEQTKAGTYDVVLSTSNGQSKTVKLTVIDKVSTDDEGTIPSTGNDKNNSGTSSSVVNATYSTVKTPTRTGTSTIRLPKTGDESSA